MARLYPNQLLNVTSAAEAQLYNVFRDELDAEYSVFHGAHWHGLDGERRPRDGEADFVIVHPRRGILVLEVKGGRIRHDPSSGRWTSTDRAGQTHVIKDPFQQARNGKYALQDQLLPKLAKPAGESQRRINIGHAVAFPDVDIGDDLSGLDRPREIVMDRGDTSNISGWVGRTMAYWRGRDTQKDTAPKEEAVTVLTDLLGKSWELRPALWGEFRREKEAFVRLTSQQFMVLDLLNRQRQALISGCAGSGKTTLAVEKARRLARQKFRVLLTCYNKSLAADLRSKLPADGNLQIFNFHDLCYVLAERAGVLPSMPPSSDAAGYQQFFEQQLPNALVDAAELLQEVRYDAIIVDEGQDFMEDWWIPLQFLLHDPEGGILHIFFDDNQRLYDRLNEFPIQRQPYPLSINCRNTRNIHKQVLRFYQGQDAPPTALGPKGRPVSIVRFSDPDLFRDRLMIELQKLVLEERVPAAEVVVLTPLRRKSRLWAEPTSEQPAGSLTLTNEWPPGPGQIYATTIHDFKGLESAVIVLVETERWPDKGIDLESLLYVACSRARHHLVVLLPVLLSPTLQRYFV